MVGGPVGAIAEADPTAAEIERVATERSIGFGSRPDSGKFMYWRKPDGRIVIKPAWPTEYLRYSELGFTPLSRYGHFFNETKEWNSHVDPYRRILELHGAHEFTVPQIRELGWHRKPPVVQGRPVHFPQLDGQQSDDIQCKYCGRWFPDQLRLNKHQSVIHREVSGNEQLARVMAEAAREQATGPLGDVLRILGQQQQTMQQLLVAMQQRQEQQEQRFNALLERFVQPTAAPPSSSPAGAELAPVIEKPRPTIGPAKTK